jgi:hypothetical protein
MITTYVIDGHDHIIEHIELDCADDNAAIEYAKHYIDGHDIELWQLDRRIARFDTRPKDAIGITGELEPPSKAASVGGLFRQYGGGDTFFGVLPSSGSIISRMPSNLVSISLSFFSPARSTDARISSLSPFITTRSGAPEDNFKSGATVSAGRGATDGSACMVSSSSSSVSGD